jgi:4'-phosphopantetheinyl transferase
MKATSQPHHLSILHWPPAPPALKLADGEVHVICAALDIPAERIAQLKLTLARDELERAKKFYFAPDERNYVAARGLLREILGRYLGMAPEQVEFRYSATGKPELAGMAEGKLNFNVAHCGDDAVFAITRNGAIGVDVERIRAVPDLLQLVAATLSEHEKAEWSKLDPPEWRRAFFDCWTRKEAFLKGTARGLSKPPPDIEVPLRPSAPEEVLEVVEHGSEVPDWSLRSLSAADYSIALAVKNSPAQVACWEWRAQ